MDNLKKALENVMREDIGRYENAAEHEFSTEFEKKMKRLSKRSATKKRVPLRIGRIFAAAAAAVALFAVGTFAGAVSSGFNVNQTKRLGLPAKLFTAADTDGCPTSIETVYKLNCFPDNQISISDNFDKDGNRTSVSSMYFSAPFEWDGDGMYAPRNDELYLVKTIFLLQETKETFDFTYADMDYVTYKTLTVNGGQAYFITRERYYGTQAYLFWESEDYIFTLSGSFTEERALELANSLVIYDGELPFSGLREV